MKKLYLVNGKPFLATDATQSYVAGEPVDVLAGVRPERDVPTGGVVLKGVTNVRQADAVEATAEQAFAALAEAVFGSGVTLT